MFEWLINFWWKLKEKKIKKIPSSNELSDFSETVVSKPEESFKDLFFDCDDCEDSVNDKCKSSDWFDCDDCEESVNDKYKSSDELVDVVVSAASVITVEDGLDVITIEDGFGSLETDNFLKYDNKFGIFYLLLDRL